MSTYFKYFPKDTHRNQLVTDITKRVDFTNTTLADPYAFLPYTIKNDYKPEDVAYYYYGDVKYTWLVYLSNNIIDPYYDWPMNYENFQKYIIKKYADLSGQTGYNVIAWTQDETSNTNIIHYKNNADEDITISTTTFNLDTSLDASEWTAVRYYDYEDQLNEDKRVINLLDNRYAQRAEKELKAILNVDSR